MSEPVPTVPLVNVATRIPRTEAEGPGWRYALWVQGCPMRCVGCCNPEMLAFAPRLSLDVDTLAREVLAQDVEGLSLLGGEPFAQAAPLAALARKVRDAGRSVMVFSGYTLAELRAQGKTDTDALLAATDLLVDGRYEAPERTTARRWIGSNNQTLHFLTERYHPGDPRFAEPNHLELRLVNGKITLNGWPLDGARTRVVPRRV